MNFIVQALEDKPITVYGDGSRTRSFCYVDDLIDALLRLMATADEVTGPVNLGNPSEFTILELARKVIELTGSKSQIVFRPLPSDGPTQRQPDITLAREVLQWAPVWTTGCEWQSSIFGRALAARHAVYLEARPPAAVSAGAGGSARVGPEFTR